MPELRKDPIIGRWVIVSTERAKRPDNFSVSKESPPEGECYFCKGREDKTPPEIYSIRDKKSKPNGPGWELRVVPSIRPALRIEGNLDRRGQGIYDLMNGIGAHEIVIETPEHIANICDLPEASIIKIILTYIKRIKDLEKDKRFKYVLVFKNYGWNAGGGRINHSRSQLIATPVTPKRLKEELVGARKFFDFKDRCIFCDIINQEIESKHRIIYDADGIIAVAPFASRFPFETWIMPKKHSCDFINLAEDEIKNLALVLKVILTKLKLALNDPPYNYMLHTAPFRRRGRAGAWRTIDQDYHWHIEIIPRLTRTAGFEWGSGFYINPTPPEEATKFLREV